MKKATKGIFAYKGLQKDLVPPTLDAHSPFVSLANTILYFEKSGASFANFFRISQWKQNYVAEGCVGWSPGFLKLPTP